ncbi:MAG: hypothetical protein KatS3mg076_2981 [Candidatus Binatia bacterium]|nr:MAG: hypothetical protein KatS3mg076_2981 [Candidatus Binatia bacterium]
MFRNSAAAIAFSPAIYQLLTTLRASFVFGVAAVSAGFIACLAPAETRLIAPALVVVGMYLGFHSPPRTLASHARGRLGTLFDVPAAKLEGVRSKFRRQAGVCTCSADALLQFGTRGKLVVYLSFSGNAIDIRAGCTRVACDRPEYSFYLSSVTRYAFGGGELVLFVEQETEFRVLVSRVPARWGRKP